MKGSEVPESALPLVTVGVPLYNADGYLSGSLDSLLAQTFRSFEIVISDNGSQDRTEEICRSYAAKDSRIRYFRHDANRGAAWNHNFVIEQARGHYFRHHHHDDLSEPRHLECCVAALEADAGAVLAYPRTTLIDAAGNVTGTYEDRLALSEETPHERLLHLLRNIYLCNAVLGLIRMDALRRTALCGAYVESDHVLLAELALQGRFIEVPEALFRRRMHAGKSTEANRTKRARAAFEDPRLATAWFLWPNTRLFAERLRAVWRADVAVLERLSCARVVVSWQAGFAARYLRASASRAGRRVAHLLGAREGVGSGKG
jgi:glycosyltransferase involved in cell wall biosynthesis